MPLKALIIQLCAVLTGAAVSGAMGADLAVNVVDQSGKALRGAVISLHGSDATQRRTVDPANRPQAVMDQRNKQFLPHVLAVQTGTAVSFPNSDDIRHHVYSFSKAKRFEIKLYHGTPSEPIVFEQAGVVTLGCNIHDQMLAYVYVTDTDLFAQTDSNGVALLKDAPPGHYALHVWHPDMGAAVLPSSRQVQLSDQAVSRVRQEVQTQQRAEPELTPLEQKFRRQFEHAH